MPALPQHSKGLSAEAGRQALKALLRVQANDAASIDELVNGAERWLFERRTLLPSDRLLRDAARKAFAVVEQAALEVIEAAVSASARTVCQTIFFERIAGDEGQTVLERLKTPAARHSPSTLADTMAKVRILKQLGAHEWQRSPADVAMLPTTRPPPSLLR